MGTHAVLSASAAHRWLTCPPSARLEETLPDRPSVHAAAGSLAHSIAELKVRKHFIEPMGKTTYNNRLKKLKDNPLFQPEMLEHTDVYLDSVKELCMKYYKNLPHVAVERKLSYAHIAPEGFGTCDCVIVGGDTLCVVDFKYGQGVPVTAEGNPQLMLYALGAIAEYGLLYQFSRVVMAIVQPRLNRITCCEMDAEALSAWGESIKPIARQAFAGEGEYRESDHCRFCRAGVLCRARADANTALELYAKKPGALLTPEEIGEIVGKVDSLVKWAAGIKDYALAEVLAGREIPGWKAVEGRAGARAFTNLDKAFERLKAHGIDEAALYERQPLSLAEVEKLIGKKLFGELLTEYIIRPKGKPALAPESDPREVYKALSVQEDLKEIKALAATG